MILRASKAAEILDYNRQRIYEFCRSGKLEAKKIEGRGNGTWWIDPDSVEELKKKLKIVKERKRKANKKKLKIVKERKRKAKMTVEDHKCYSCPFSSKLSKNKLYLPFSHCIWKR
jgi:hypothetical protein